MCGYNVLLLFWQVQLVRVQDRSPSIQIIVQWLSLHDVSFLFWQVQLVQLGETFVTSNGLMAILTTLKHYFGEVFSLSCKVQGNYSEQ